MKLDTLRCLRRVVGKFDHYPNQQLERQLIDSHLEALDRIAQLERQVQELEGPPPREEHS